MPLIDGLLLALARTAPTTLYAHLAEALYQALDAYPAAAEGLLARGLEALCAGARASGSRAEELAGCARAFHALALGFAREHRKPMFKTLASEFAKAFRGDAPADALQSFLI